MSKQLENIITKQMLEEMSYNSPKKPTSVLNNLKGDYSLTQYTLTVPKISPQEAASLVRSLLENLAELESEHNCIPYSVAESHILHGLTYDNIHISEGLPVDEDHVFKGNCCHYYNLSAVLSLVFTILVMRHVNATATIIADSPRKELIDFLFVHCLGFEITETQPTEAVVEQREKYTAIFIFNRSDLNAAAHYIAKSFEDPFNIFGIRNIFVQESCEDELIAKIKSKLRSYPPEVLRDEYFSRGMSATLGNLEKLNATTIKASRTDKIVPTIVPDFGREYFEKLDQKYSPAVISMKTFRTAKEAVSLVKQQGLFKAITIWSENHSLAYEIIGGCRASTFYVNCYNISFGPLLKIENFILHLCDKYLRQLAPSSGVCIENSYHYEFYKDEAGGLKRVVFPIGTTFAN